MAGISFEDLQKALSLDQPKKDPKSELAKAKLELEQTKLQLAKEKAKAQQEQAKAKLELAKAKEQRQKEQEQAKAEREQAQQKRNAICYLTGMAFAVGSLLVSLLVAFIILCKY